MGEKKIGLPTLQEENVVWSTKSQSDSSFIVKNKERSHRQKICDKTDFATS